VPRLGDCPSPAGCLPDFIGFRFLCLLLTCSLLTYVHNPRSAPCSAHDLVIAPHSNGLVKTDLAVAILPGCYGRVAPRSSLALKKQIDVGAGVIDCDYRGPLGVVLFNHGENAFEVKRGDRIAQLILERIATPPVEEVDDLDATSRGAGGFGSTGLQTEGLGGSAVHM
jgi:dUTP diphosphatase